MTNEEFSNAFDTLLSSHATDAMYGEGVSIRDIVLDEYEKSLYLTRAQEEIVSSLYDGKNALGDAFESSEEMRRYLSNLVEEATEDPIKTSDGKPLGLESNSKFFTLPEDLWFITYEAVSTDGTGCAKKASMRVYPVKQDEYQVIRDNPFRGTNNRRALRLDLSDGVVEIICKFNVTKYYVRYVRKLKPIILVDLPNGLSINKESIETPCELHESLHSRILERAVTLAIQSKSYTQRTTTT